ncbi:MAG: bifunctional oligoribonuclease/PAP phosphatase NrnA [Clostridia bacterium]|nr:bifunctional oligoribonuclease/PAP phosphatase NrnA [Clostridia bacterium]
MTLDKINEEINRAKNIAILTHENPDGDAIGSSLALYQALTALNKEVCVIIPEYSRIFDFLPYAEVIKKEYNGEKYDLVICLDTATIKMLSVPIECFENAKSTIIIDHHGTNTMYGDINFVNPDSPACSQVLITIFEYFKWEITKDIGTCLITGIITDTGGFQYSNVKVETFEFAAELLSRGINIPDVYKRTLDTKTRPSFELSKIATERMEFLEDGKIAFTYITLEDEKKVNSGTGDHEGIVNIGGSVENVEVSIFIRQVKDNIYKVSLRANEYVNVSDVCLIFGGGGHVKAAGCKMTGTVEQIKESLIKEVKLQLKKEG